MIIYFAFFAFVSRPSLCGTYPSQLTFLHLME
jgi:hypothetical protein